MKIPNSLQGKGRMLTAVFLLVCLELAGCTVLQRTGQQSEQELSLPPSSSSSAPSRTPPAYPDRNYADSLDTAAGKIIASGADDASLEEAMQLREDLLALREYLVFLQEEGEECGQGIQYLDSCAALLHLFHYTATAGEDENFADRSRQLETCLSDLAQLTPEEICAKWMPSYNSSDQSDLRLTLASCEMRRRFQREQQARCLTLTVGGDTTFGQYPEVEEQEGTVSFRDELTSRGGDYSFPLSLCRPFFSTDHLSILNCEGTFTRSDDARQKKYRFKGDPEFAQMFALGGVEMVSLANNHSYDYKEQGLQDTYQALTDAGVSYFDEGLIGYKVTVEGRVACIGYNLFGKEPDMTEVLSRDIGEARKRGADLVVVSFHWGYEYYNQTSPHQRETGRLAVDLGADLVVGHHPHVIQGIEIYKGKTILYSLGNFAFGGDEEVKDGGDTFLFRQSFSIEKDGAIPGESLIIPCSVSSTEGRNNYTPKPLFGEEADRVVNRLLELSGQMEYGLEQAQYLKTTETGVS